MEIVHFSSFAVGIKVQMNVSMNICVATELSPEFCVLRRVVGGDAKSLNFRISYFIPYMSL